MMRTKASPSLAISCVVDNQPKFRLQACLWLETLRQSGNLDVLTPYIHCVGPAPDYFLQCIRELGANVVSAVSFGDGPAAYCNKLQQLPTFCELEHDGVFLTDADMVFVGDIGSMFDPDVIQAKIVDDNNPPESLLIQLLDVAGFVNEELRTLPHLAKTGVTHANNCNGGMYILPSRLLHQVAGSWRHWSTFCLQQENLLTRWLLHSDQLGFMLSMIETELELQHLPIGANCPTHFGPMRYESAEIGEIQVLHYHHRLDSEGQLQPVGHPAIDQAITKANISTERFRQTKQFKRVLRDYRDSLTEQHQPAVQHVQ